MAQQKRTAQCAQNFLAPCVEYIGMYWDILGQCDCLWMFMLDDFDSFWWFVMAGYGWHMYDHVWKCKICHGRGPICGGAHNIYNLHLLKFTFGFFPQSLKLHGIAMFWMFLIVFDYFWQAPIMPFHAWSKCQQPRPHQQYQRERTMQCAQLCWEFLGTLCRIVWDIFWYIWNLNIVSDGLWWREHGGKCKISWGRGPDHGGVHCIYNLHLLNFTFGLFSQSLKMHGISWNRHVFACFWLFLDDQDWPSTTYAWPAKASNP